MKIESVASAEVSVVCDEHWVRIAAASGARRIMMVPHISTGLRAGPNVSYAAAVPSNVGSYLVWDERESIDDTVRFYEPTIDVTEGRPLVPLAAGLGIQT